MKLFIGLLFCWMGSLFCYGQGSDTLCLNGTCAIPNTTNQLLASNYGFTLESVSYVKKWSDTKQAHWRDKIVEITKSDSNLVIVLRMSGNSCHHFLGDVEVVDNKMLNLLVFGYGANYCASSSYHEIQFDFFLENFEARALIETVMINGKLDSQVSLNQ